MEVQGLSFKVLVKAKHIAVPKKSDPSIKEVEMYGGVYMNKSSWQFGKTLQLYDHFEFKDKDSLLIFILSQDPDDIIIPDESSY